MALFSQDDLGEDNERSGLPDFSGLSPVDPDEETETPSPVEADQTSETPEVAQPDDANIYAQSPDEEHGDDEGREASLAPGDDSDGAIYAQPAAGAPAAQDSGTDGGAQLPSMPQYVDNLPNYQALEKEISNFKPSDYKPSVGRRILAGLSGGAIAFGSRNVPAALSAEEGVLNDPLNRARASEQQQEQATRQQIADVNAQNQTRQAQYQNQRTAANDAALNDQRNQRAQDFKAQADARGKVPVGFVPDDKDNPYAGGTVTLANGTTVKGPPPDKWLDAWERDPANKALADAQRGVQTLKALEAAGVTLTPEQKAIVASGGKVTPAVRTTVNIRENPDGSAVTPGGENDPQTLIAQHLQDKQSFADGWQRVDAAHAGPGVPEGSYVPADTDLNDVKTGDFKPGKTNFLSGQQFNDKIDKFRTDLNAKPEMQKARISLDQNGNVTRAGRSTVPTPVAPTPAAAAPKTFDRTQIPKNVPLPAGSVWVQAPNGTIGHIPQANLQKAISRGYAVPADQAQTGGGSGPPNPQ